MKCIKAFFHGLALGKQLFDRNYFVGKKITPVMISFVAEK
jgi:hypothetical protein